MDHRSSGANKTEDAHLSDVRTLLSVGVTGHRLDRLGVQNVAQVDAAVKSLLAAIEAATPMIRSGDRRLVTGLAEGVDSIASDRAVERGWRVDAVLPFFRDEFAADFAPGAAREAYHARLSACAAVLELPGGRDAEGDSGLAYERAGHLILAQSDLLVAIWDGHPARGRGGAAEIVAEAVLRGLPVIHLHPTGKTPPTVLWNGLQELDLGQQTVETVARGDLASLPRALGDVLGPLSDTADRTMLERFGQRRLRRWTTALAYPLLLAAIGVRRPRLADFRDRPDDAGAAVIGRTCSAADAFENGAAIRLAAKFARADTLATRSAQRFRSSYVANFALAAFSVLLSLLELVLPGFKPILLALELSAIGAILVQTRTGNRAAWHRLWLDHRALAERLRCLAVSAQLGNPGSLARGAHLPAWVAWFLRATARDLGIPSVRLDDDHLGRVRADLLRLLDDQILYLAADARRMHHLEHRLHRLGTLLFGVTAFACVAVLAFEVMARLIRELDTLRHPVAITATMIGAALPAIGAAIYGIRMQGDFGGVAERSSELVDQLRLLRAIVRDEALTFDALSRRVERATALLTEHLTSWLHTYHARPLTLPG